MKKTKDIDNCFAPPSHHAQVPVIGVILYYSLLGMADGYRISASKLFIMSVDIRPHLHRRVTYKHFLANDLLAHSFPFAHSQHSFLIFG